MRLSCKMSERMDTLTDKMKAVRVSVTIENFEVEDPLEEKFVRGVQLFSRDRILVNDPDGSDKLTEMMIIYVWKDAVENAWALAVEIVEIFPSFVTARDLFLWISGGPAERSWEIFCSA